MVLGTLQRKLHTGRWVLHSSLGDLDNSLMPDVLRELDCGGSYMPHLVAYWLHNLTREGAGPLYSPTFLSLAKS